MQVAWPTLVESLKMITGAVTGVIGPAVIWKEMGVDCHQLVSINFGDD